MLVFGGVFLLVKPWSYTHYRDVASMVPKDKNMTPISQLGDIHES